MLGAYRYGMSTLLRWRAWRECEAFFKIFGDGLTGKLYTWPMPKPKTLQLDKIIKTQQQFVKERDWSQFHTPKNIAMALGIEASELAEIFLWLTDKESKGVMKDKKTAQRVRAEVADVFYWLTRLCDVLEIDLEASFYEKMEENRKKYPKNLAKGKMTKYTDL